MLQQKKERERPLVNPSPPHVKGEISDPLLDYLTFNAITLQLQMI